MARKTVQIDCCDWCGKSLATNEFENHYEKDLELCPVCGDLKAMHEGLARGLAKSPGKTPVDVLESWLDLYNDEAKAEHGTVPGN